MLLASFQNPSDILLHELEYRQTHNCAYSLRAFARDLKISPSRLSEIMNKNGKLSYQNAKNIASTLFQNIDDQQYFIDLVLTMQSEKTLQTDNAHFRVLRYREAQDYIHLREDEFKTISDWHHLAILELFYIEDFIPTIENFSKKLQIKVSEIKQAVARLESLNILKIEMNDIKLNFKRLNIQSPIPSSHIRYFHRQLILKSLTAMESQTPQQREFSSMFIAVNSNQLSEFKEKIGQLQQEIKTVANNQTQRDSVYALTVQFFKVTE